jgi:hypothetical protein
MNLSKITAKYIGKSFREYGCIELVVNFMRDIEKPLPDEVDGIDVINYRDLIDEDIKKAQRVMIRTFRKIGTPANAKYPSIGDLLVVLQPHCRGIFPAVAIGHGNAIASFIGAGVMAFNLDRLNVPIMARRVI